MKRKFFLCVAILILTGCGSWVLSLSLMDTFTVGGSPSYSAINKQTDRLFVSDAAAGSVSMYNASTGEKIATTPTGSQPQAVAVDPKKNLVYVVNRASNSLTVLDGNTNAKLVDIIVGTSPQGLDLDLNNNRAFVSNVGSNDVTVVNTLTRTVIKTIPVGIDPWAVAYDVKGGWIYVANTGEGTVARINPNTNVTMAKVDVGGRPWNIKVSRNLGKVFVTNETLGNLVIIQRDRVVKDIVVGDTPFGLALHDELLFAYVAMKGSNMINAVDMLERGIVAELSVGLSPSFISFDPAIDDNTISGKLYVLNQGDGTISVVAIRFSRFV